MMYLVIAVEVTVMNEVKELLGLKNNNKVKIISVEEHQEYKEKVQIITLKGVINKVKCPICLKYTSSVHDKLRPIRIKYNKVVDRKCYLILLKRRFICHRCKKKIVEDLGINSYNRTISNLLEIKIRKDLLALNLNIQQIANENNVSHNEVRKILKDTMSDYPNHVKTLPQVISLDEFAAHTSYGKYALIINDPIKKKTLDILPSRKKDYLMGYFTKVENRGNVRYVIGDMYDTYLIVTKVMFKNAKYIVNRFHFIIYIMDALDDIRITLQDKYGYNSREYKLLKNNKNVSLLRKRYVDINWYVYVKRYEKGRYVYKLPKNILSEILAIDDELNRDYDLKELFLDIINNSTCENAEKDLLIWIDLCKESKIRRIYYRKLVRIHS